MDPSSFMQKLFSDSRKLRKGADVTAYEAFMGFYHAVTWRDPGVMCLLGFHVVYAAVCIAFRNSPNAHIALFLLTCALNYSASHINTFMAKHWRDFGFSQNYFDRHGVFLSSLFCAPLLLIAFGQMLFTLLVSCKLLVEAGKKKVKLQMARQAAELAKEGKEGAVPGAPPLAPNDGEAKGAEEETKKEK